jgi:hypothetical protein
MYSNILFSALVGFATIVNPLANYLLKFYFVAVTTLWATTFSLAVLFIPKLYMFWKRRSLNASEATTKQQQQWPQLNGDDQRQHSFLKSSTVYTPTTIDVSNLRRNAVDYSNQDPDLTVENDTYYGRYDSTNVYVEVQEVIEQHNVSSSFR